MVRNRFYVALPGSCPEQNLTNFAATAQLMPLANGTMDAVVLHHALECADDPRQVMREISRILAPGGRLVICGFNPWSAWGATNLWRRAAGSGDRFVSKRRLLDWLAVLGLELDGPVRYAGYGLTNGRHGVRWQQRLRTWQVPVAASFVVAVTKQTMALRPPLRDRALSSGKLAPVAYPKLSAWDRTRTEN